MLILIEEHQEVATKIEDTSLDAEIDELLEDYPDEDDE
jgi:hypothetical protein